MFVDDAWFTYYQCACLCNLWHTLLSHLVINLIQLPLACLPEAQRDVCWFCWLLFSSIFIFCLPNDISINHAASLYDEVLLLDAHSRHIVVVDWSAGLTFAYSSKIYWWWWREKISNHVHDTLVIRVNFFRKFLLSQGHDCHMEFPASIGFLLKETDAFQYSALSGGSKYSSLMGDLSASTD